MKNIPLTKGKVALVDDEDYEYLSQFNWWLSTTGYACRDKTINRKRSRYFMHREIMNAPKGMEVDHINGNRLDNRKENLRVVNKLDNMLNTPVRSHNSTGFKGVQEKRDYPRKKPFVATIKHNKKTHHLGHFKTPEEAARAYDKASIALHGEFGRTNFPIEVENE